MNPIHSPPFIVCNYRILNLKYWKFMKTCFPVLFALLLASSLQAQDNKPLPKYGKNAIYVELLGSGWLYSVGYERTWYQNRFMLLHSSIGTGYIPSGDGEHLFTPYIEGAAAFGNVKTGMFELGCAYGYYPSNRVALATHNSYHQSYLIPRAGFRIAFAKNKMFFKAAFTPMLNLTPRPLKNRREYEDLKFSRPWLGLALGYRFGK